MLIRPSVLVSALALMPLIAGAQTYPSRPVRVITPFTAGSAIDTLARVLGQKMADAWGQQVIIDNRIGANGIIGTEAAAKSPPDGYTIYLGNISTLAVNRSRTLRPSRWQPPSRSCS
jgi:tripartite-type tricarboxylate transporter receptor subunit TctC